MSKCKTPDYEAFIVHCVVQMGFLNCPAALLSVTSECEELKNIVLTQDKCGKDFGGTFIVEADFFYEVVNAMQPSDSSNTTDDFPNEASEN